VKESATRIEHKTLELEQRGSYANAGAAVATGFTASRHTTRRGVLGLVPSITFQLMASWREASSNGMNCERRIGYRLAITSPPFWWISGFGAQTLSLADVVVPLRDPPGCDLTKY
jgi:hypothetical protein